MANAKWQMAFSSLLVEERRKSWEDDVNKMEEILGKEGTDGTTMEIYSPPRINAVAAMWGLLPGWSIDFTIDDPDDGKPWDFNCKDKRDKALGMVLGKRALLLIGSPMCTAFSRLQNWNFKKMPREKVQQSSNRDENISSFA